MHRLLTQILLSLQKEFLISVIYETMLKAHNNKENIWEQFSNSVFKWTILFRDDIFSPPYIHRWQMYVCVLFLVQTQHLASKIVAYSNALLQLIAINIIRSENGLHVYMYIQQHSANTEYSADAYMVEASCVNKII